MQAHYTRFTRESVFLGRPSPSQVLVICNISLCFSREGHFFGQRLAQTLSSMRKMQQDTFLRESRRGRIRPEKLLDKRLVFLFFLKRFEMTL